MTITPTKSLAKVDAKIAQMEVALAELRRARDILAETLELTPKHPDGKIAGLVVDISGVPVAAGTKQAAVLILLASVEGEGCVPFASIRDLVGDGRKCAEMLISRLRKKLKASGAPYEIAHFPKEGYRLQAMQEAA